jgi:hypothetical protein
MVRLSWASEKAPWRPARASAWRSEREGALAAGARLGLEDETRQAFDAGAQFLVLQLAHDVAIALRQFADDGAGEHGVLSEHAAHGFGRNHQDLRRRQRARRFQIDLVMHHGGEDEGGDRLQDGDGGFARSVGGEQFDGAVDDYVQEVRQFSLLEENHMGGKTLQERATYEVFELRVGHVPKQGQGANDVGVSAAHRVIHSSASLLG